MSEERCEKHDMVLSGCADCRGLGPLVERPELLVDHFFTAKYNGKCVLDHKHHIHKGDLVGAIVEDNDEGRPPFTGVGTACTDCTNEVADGGSRGI